MAEKGEDAEFATQPQASSSTASGGAVGFLPRVGNFLKEHFNADKMKESLSSIRMLVSSKQERDALNVEKMRKEKEAEDTLLNRPGPTEETGAGAGFMDDTRVGAGDVARE